MQHRTLEEYKEEVFDRLDEQTKLEWLYEMSEKLCNIEEYIKNNSYFKDNVVKTMIFQDYSNGILNIIGGDDNE